MRTELKKLYKANVTQIEASAYVFRSGHIYNKHNLIKEENNLLLTDIKDSNNNFLCDHVWVLRTNKIKKRMKKNISFLANIITYTRKDGTQDFTLLIDNKSIHTI